MSHTKRNPKVGNLPSSFNLTALLREVEVKHIEVDDGAVEAARMSVVGAIDQCHATRYDLGKTLSAYKAFFAAGRVWMTVAKIVAKAMNCDESTIRRVVEDFQRTTGIPAVAINALKKQRIDPAAKKNKEIINSLAAMPDGIIEENPEAAVACALKAAKKPSKRVAARSSDQPTPTREEKQRLEIRLKIRSAIISFPIEQRLEELKHGLEEEMFDWGVTEPVTIVLIPRSGSPVVDTSEVGQETAPSLKGAA
jgi:hypothetical protein